MDQFNKRRFIRHSLVNPLEFHIESDKYYEKTDTINLSEGGLMFNSKKEVAPGTLITIHLPLYDKVFDVKAKVVYANKKEPDKVYNVGVSFVRYADAFKVKLIEQIYLIEEYRVLRSLQIGKEMTIQEASQEWIKRYSERFQRLHW